MDVGDTKHFDVRDAQGNYWKIPKDPNRRYEGMGILSNVFDDIDESNQQTTDIRVVNYFEDVPVNIDDDFVLEQNFPNPSNGTTRIEFALPYGGNARFFVNDAVGRQVHEQSSFYPQGRHIIDLKKGDLPAGVYYYGIEFDGQRRMRKMIIR